MFYLVFLLAPAFAISGLDCMGSRTIRTRSDLAKIQGCYSYVGSLTIDATEPLDIALDLESQVGDFDIIGENIMNVQLNKLKGIAGDFLIKASNVETIQLNALKTKAGSIEIFDSKKLKKVSFNNLRSVVGDLKFKNLDSVELVALPLLKILCGDFDLTDVDKLTTFSLPSMEAYEVKISIDSKSLNDLNLGKMVEKSGSNINFRNKATLKLNTNVEKDCKVRNIGDNNINQVINDVNYDGISNSIQSNYVLLFTSVASILYSATQ